MISFSGEMSSTIRDSVPYFEQFAGECDQKHEQQCHGHGPVLQQSVTQTEVALDLRETQSRRQLDLRPLRVQHVCKVMHMLQIENMNFYAVLPIIKQS